MSTFEEIYQRLRHAGISHEDAQKEAQIQTNYERGLAAQAEAAQAQAANPAPAHTWDRYDEIERRTAAQWDHIHNPTRIAQIQAEEQRLTAAIEALDKQLAPLQQQRAALAEQLGRLRFRG